MTRKKEVAIRFFTAINDSTVGRLFEIVDKKLSEGVDKVTLLLSSPGGVLTSGVATYNFLRGIPAEVVTHNFGSVDSIALLMFCAGSIRYSVPSGRFLFHEPSRSFPQGTELGEAKLREHLTALQFDTHIMAEVIATAIGQESDRVKDLLSREVLFTPEQALKLGLVHEIRKYLIPKGAEIIAVHTPSSPSPQR